MLIFFQEPDADLHKPALESLRSQIRASTSSMTSVPKPLKFLRQHFDALKDLHSKWPDSENKVKVKLNFAIFLDSSKLKIVWIKITTVFKQCVSIIL